MTSVLRIPVPMPIGRQALEGEGWCSRPLGPGADQPRLGELLGTLAHELRSPLATIIIAAQMIANAHAIELPTRRALAVMERQSRQALRLIDDLFDVCAGTQDKLSLRKESVGLADLVAAATETAGHLLTARRHRLMVSLPPGPVSFEGDPLRLEQVLTNLLGNAAKFTDPGGHIHLTAGVEADRIVLRVRDNGRGIDSDLLPRLFDLFYQVPGPGTRGAGGVGIGLALVKALVDLHGGSVAAFSAGPGTGAEFIVRLPLVPADRGDLGRPTS